MIVWSSAPDLGAVGAGWAAWAWSGFTSCARPVDAVSNASNDAVSNRMPSRDGYAREVIGWVGFVPGILGDCTGTDWAADCRTRLVRTDATGSGGGNGGHA